MKKRLSMLLLILLPALSALKAGTSVSILTAMPGKEIYELEGHTGLRIQDPDRGIDMVVNWGLFDFYTDSFVYHFVKGETDYLCGAVPTESFISSYTSEGRRVVEQTLSLDSIETRRLMQMVNHNLLPANRTYRYNYVLDNCATRPVAIIEKSTGEPLLSDMDSGSTFRREMQRFHRHYPWYQFGIDLALGRGLDAPVTLKQSTFAPVTLMDQLAHSPRVTHTAAYGTQTLVHRPTHPLLTPLAAAILLLAATLAITLQDWRRRRLSRWFDSVLFTIFAITGSIIYFLVFVSTHEATSPNILILWLNPFCLLGAVLPWIKSARKLSVCYFFVNFALLILLTVLAPVLGRYMNPAFWPLIAADAIRSVANITLCPKANRT